MRETIAKVRTFRRFNEEERLNVEILHQLIDLARLGGSARNQQSWQYSVVHTRELCDKVFPCLGWAGYLPEWKGPEMGERPSAYVLCFLNRNWLKGSEGEAHFDLGIATQNLLLGAMDLGIGGCRIGAFNPRLEQVFEIPDHLQLSLVVALGRPRETVIIEECGDEGDIRYWRDENGCHHVPKRSLQNCLLELKTIV